MSRRTRRGDRRHQPEQGRKRTGRSESRRSIHFAGARPGRRAEEQQKASSDRSRPRILVLDAGPPGVVVVAGCEVLPFDELVTSRRGPPRNQEKGTTLHVPIVVAAIELDDISLVGSVPWQVR